MPSYPFPHILKCGKKIVQRFKLFYFTQISIYIDINSFFDLWIKFGWWILSGVTFYVFVRFTYLKATRNSPTTFIFWFLEFWHVIIVGKFILVSLTNYNLYHCPLSVTILKVHLFHYVDPLAHVFIHSMVTTFHFHFSFPIGGQLLNH